MLPPAPPAAEVRSPQPSMPQPPVVACTWFLRRHNQSRFALLGWPELTAFHPADTAIRVAPPGWATLAREDSEAWGPARAAEWNPGSGGPVSGAAARPPVSRPAWRRFPA